MWMHLWRRITRKPLPLLAVAAFAAAITLALCALHANNAAEEAAYLESRAKVEVPFAVTNLAGSQSQDIMVPGFLADAFAGQGDGRPLLDGYVSQLQILQTYSVNSSKDGVLDGFRMCGILDLKSDRLISPNAGGEIEWYPGYDESVFQTGELVCIVPKQLAEEGVLPEDGVLELTFVGETTPPNPPNKITREFTVVGLFSNDKIAVDGAKIWKAYCPYRTMRQIYLDLSIIYEKRTVDVIRGVLRDNDQLEEFRKAANEWMPNAGPDAQPWEYETVGYYFTEFYFAIDIDDSLLQSLTNSYQNSMAINRLSLLLVFALSAGAGFLVGFLMIRSRKREIGQLRTLGTPGAMIYISYALEQMAAIAVGIGVGGAFFRYEPVAWLALFAGIYFVGLSAALLIFLRRNLLASMKEEETS